MMASGCCSTIENPNRRKLLMNKKFWLSLICDYQEDPEEGDIDFVLSKGHVMCWISFFCLMFVATSQMYGIKYDSANLTVALDVLKTIFTTTFTYSAFKIGVKAYVEK